MCNEKTVQAINDCYEVLEENHFTEGVDKLKERRAKSVELQEDYFFCEEEKMAESFVDVVQDSPRTGLGIPVKSKKPLYRTNTPPA